MVMLTKIKIFLFSIILASSAIGNVGFFSFKERPKLARSFVVKPRLRGAKVANSQLEGKLDTFLKRRKLYFIKLNDFEDYFACAFLGLQFSIQFLINIACDPAGVEGEPLVGDLIKDACKDALPSFSETREAEKAELALWLGFVLVSLLICSLSIYKGRYIPAAVSHGFLGFAAGMFHATWAILGLGIYLFVATAYFLYGYCKKVAIFKRSRFSSVYFRRLFTITTIPLAIRRLMERWDISMWRVLCVKFEGFKVLHVVVWIAICLVVSAVLQHFKKDYFAKLVMVLGFGIMIFRNGFSAVVGPIYEDILIQGLVGFVCGIQFLIWLFANGSSKSFKKLRL